MSYEHGDSRRVDGRRRLWRFVLLFFFLSHSFFTIIDCFYFFARDFWFDLKQKLKSYHLYLLWFNFWVLFIYLFIYLFFSEIFDDIREECSKFGRIRSLQIPRPSTDHQVLGVGKVWNFLFSYEPSFEYWYFEYLVLGRQYRL